MPCSNTFSIRVWIIVASAAKVIVDGHDISIFGYSVATSGRIGVWSTAKSSILL
jgi:hypothetical protein